MQQPQEPVIELKGITITEVNTILEGLGTMPFNRVAAIIPKIVNQVQTQMAPKAPAPPAPPEDGKDLDGGSTDETPPVH